VAEGRGCQGFRLGEEGEAAEKVGLKCRLHQIFAEMSSSLS
jgi:hypothetical protein